MAERRTPTHRLDQAHADIGELSGALARRGRLDMEGAVLSGASYEVHVSGSSELTTVEAAADRGLEDAGEYQRVVKVLERVAGILYDTWAEMTPKATGEQCPTVAYDADGMEVACQGQVTHRGLCHNCHRHRRKGQPAPDALLLKSWNAQLPKPCRCPLWCCPDGCEDLASAGERLSVRCAANHCQCGSECCPDGCADPQEHGRISERCHKRSQRRKSGERHPWDCREVS